MAHDPSDFDPSLPPVTLAVREPRLRKPPFWMVAIFLIFMVGTWIPLAVIARGRVSTSTEPRIHLVQDMGTQPKYREQQSSDIFADGRADRPRVNGTVARGSLQEDDSYFRGYTVQTAAGGAEGKPAFVEAFPQQIKVDEALLHRGQQRFNIYCAVCHGQDGQGNGPVAARAAELQEPKWTKPANLTTDPVKSRSNGHIFNTINVGIRNMPGYGAQIGEHDRWAIVAYVRALQLSQNAPPAAAASASADGAR